jgi:hypothetical protein
MSFITVLFALYCSVFFWGMKYANSRISASLGGEEFSLTLSDLKIIQVTLQRINTWIVHNNGQHESRLKFLGLGLLKNIFDLSRNSKSLSNRYRDQSKSTQPNVESCSRPGRIPIAIVDYYQTFFFFFWDTEIWPSLTAAVAKIFFSHLKSQIANLRAGRIDRGECDALYFAMFSMTIHSAEMSLPVEYKEMSNHLTEYLFYFLSRDNIYWKLADLKWRSVLRNMQMISKAKVRLGNSDTDADSDAGSDSDLELKLTMIYELFSKFLEFASGPFLKFSFTTGLMMEP